MNLNYTLINSKSLEELIPNLTEDLQALTKTVDDNEEVTADAYKAATGFSPYADYITAIV